MLRGQVDMAVGHADGNGLGGVGDGPSLFPQNTADNFRNDSSVHAHG